MAQDRPWEKTGPVAPRGEASGYFVQDGVAGRILNMMVTDTGTLRSVPPPVEYQPSEYFPVGQHPDPGTVDYDEPFLGLFHCLVEGGARDLLIAHFTEGGVGRVMIHNGWDTYGARVPGVPPGWQTLLGDTPDAIFRTSLPEDDDLRGFLTQFEATPNGVVIVPQGSGAYFYDGVVCLPLGYSHAPSPPEPLGPRPTIADNLAGEPIDVVNGAGYLHRGRNMPRALGPCRPGTVDPRPSASGADIVGGQARNPIGGRLLEGEWRAALQWVDRWGNLSPISPLSAPVVFEAEDNFVIDAGEEEERVDQLKLQFAWVSLGIGPEGTMGRILHRTKDLRHSVQQGLYQMPLYATGGSLAFATLPDNSSTIYPDNIPDSWLVFQAEDVDATPNFRLCCVAFGRLWGANMVDDPGRLQATAPGKWGTFLRSTRMYPDVRGEAITGLWAVGGGLLVFTTTSTYRIELADDGVNFRASTVSSVVGCVSPNSLGTLPNGVTVWLGREGFYGYDGERVVLISQNIQDGVIRRINKSRRHRACATVCRRSGEYRCWIPVDGSERNSLCMVFDGTGWRERDEVVAAAVCTTRDDRALVLVLGWTDALYTPAGGGAGGGIPSIGNHGSVWVQDHMGTGVYEAQWRESVFETSWLKVHRSQRRSSMRRLLLWLRETGPGTLLVQAMRDGRRHPVVDLPEAPSLFPEDDDPPVWDTVLLGSEYTNDFIQTGDRTIDRHWVKRRAYWTKVDVYLPAAEAYRFRFRYTGDWEIVGFVFEDKDSHAGGAKVP